MADGIKKPGLFLMEWLAFGAASFVLGAVFAYMVYYEQNLIRNRERERLAVASSVSGTLVAHQLETISLALEKIRVDLAPDWRGGSRAAPLLRSRLKTLASAMFGVRTLVILDASGRVVASNQDVLIGRDFPQRPYFQDPLRDSRPDVLYVSPPYESVLGTWIITVSRAIIGPDGAFAGVVAASLDPGTFGVVLNAVRDAPDTWAAIVHGDGTLFVWEPRREGVVGQNLARPGTFFSRHMTSGRQASLFEGEVIAIKENSLMALYTVQSEALRMSQPLVVTLGRNLDAVLAGWRSSARSHAVLYAGLICVGALFLFVAQRWRSRSEARLHAVQVELESFFSIAPNLLGIADLDGVCHKLNPAWGKLMGYQEGDLQGRPYLDFFHPEDRDAVAGVIRDLRDGKTVTDFVARFRHKNGSYRFLEWAAAAHDGIIYAAAHDITERREAEAHLYSLAYHDRLTGLPNRALFFDRLAQTLAGARRGQKRFGLLFVDLDGFKKVNDDFGHEAGDTVLRVVAERFVATLRATDTVARMGGDEFVVILHELDSVQDAACVAQKILDAVALEIELSPSQSCRVGASIGISLYPDNGTDMDDLLMAADTAMYHCKNTGKNRYVLAGAFEMAEAAVALGQGHVVGVPVMDEQHLKMVGLVNRLCEAVRPNGDALEIERRFAELAEFTAFHFMTEHRLMERCAYPHQSQHDMAHALLLDEIQKMRPEMFKGGRQFLACHLERWTLDHILAEDMALGAFLRERGGPDA